MSTSLHLNRILSSFFVFGIIALFSGVGVRAEGPASRPAPKKADEYPKIECNEWSAKIGYEGNCIVETRNSKWEVGYSKEGKEDRKRTGTVRNLVVLFHADGYSHRVHEWWDSVVGPGKALNTNDYAILSLGTPGDFKPKEGAVIYLSTDEILTAQLAVIDYLFPKAKVIVGGPSRGGQIAILFSIKYPDRVKKLALVAIHGFPVPSEKKIVDYLNSLSSAEMEAGPYDFWNPSKKAEWWTPPSKDYLTISYTDEYFKTSKWMSEHGKKPEEYKDSASFRAIVLKSWVENFVTYFSPAWYGTQIRVLQESMDQTKEAEFKKLPEDILLVSFRHDGSVAFEDTSRFVNVLRKVGKDVDWKDVDDIRGHMACCSPEMNSEALAAIRHFFK